MKLPQVKIFLGYEPPLGELLALAVNDEELANNVLEEVVKTANEKKRKEESLG